MASPIALARIPYLGIRCAQLLKRVTHQHEATVLFYEEVWRNLAAGGHLRKRIEITHAGIRRGFE